jgi:hypothetical protein
MFKSDTEQHRAKLNGSLLPVYSSPDDILFVPLFCPVSTCMFVASGNMIIVDSCCSDDGGFIY